MKCTGILIFLFLLSTFLFAVAPPPLFQLLSSKETGIRFSNNSDKTENLNVLAYEYFYNGGGVAVGDINNDRLEDIFFTANIKDNKLFPKLGGRMA